MPRWSGFARSITRRVRMAGRAWRRACTSGVFAQGVSKTCLRASAYEALRQHAFGVTDPRGRFVTEKLPTISDTIDRPHGGQLSRSCFIRFFGALGSFRVHRGLVTEIRGPVRAIGEVTSHQPGSQLSAAPSTHLHIGVQDFVTEKSPAISDVIDRPRGGQRSRSCSSSFSGP
jgi:hypothetical protein